MGAASMMVGGEGTSMLAVFKALKKEARARQVYDSYDGTISTIESWSNNTREYAQSGLDVEQYLRGVLGQLKKYEAVGVCLREPTAERAGAYVFAGWAAI